MAIALEGVDLAALLAVYLLIALTVALVWTFERMADVLDFSVLGVHPLRGVANAIRSTIIAGLNEGLNALQDVASTLHEGLVWSWNIMLDGLKDLANGAESAFNYLHDHGIIRIARIVADPIGALAQSAWTYADSVFTTLVSETRRLDHKIEQTAVATLATADRDIRDMAAAIEADVGARLRTVESTIEDELRTAIAGAESVATDAIGTLRRAEDAAIGALRDAEGATAGELRDILGRLDPAAVGTIIASVPILAELVRTLEAETGLGNKECRDKVKGICSTPTSSWLRLLEGLALTAALADVHELLKLFEDGARMIVPRIEELVS